MNEHIEHPETFAAAADINPYRLAARWADRMIWDGHELGELATMQGLRAALTAWLPLALHRALLATGSVPAVCEAANLTPVEIDVAWRRWATAQRNIYVGGRPGLSSDDYATVGRILREHDGEEGEL